MARIRRQPVLSDLFQGERYGEVERTAEDIFYRTLFKQAGLELVGSFADKTTEEALETLEQCGGERVVRHCAVWYGQGWEVLS
jgi:hypothetical protein